MLGRVERDVGRMQSDGVVGEGKFLNGVELTNSERTKIKMECTHRHGDYVYSHIQAYMYKYMHICTYKSWPHIYTHTHMHKRMDGQIHFTGNAVFVFTCSNSFAEGSARNICDVGNGMCR